MDKPNTQTLRLLTVRIAELCRFTNFRSVCGGFVLQADFPAGWPEDRHTSVPDFAWSIDAAVMAQEWLLKDDYSKLCAFAHLLRQILRRHRGEQDWDSGSEDWWCAMFTKAPAWTRCIVAQNACTGL